MTAEWLPLSEILGSLELRNVMQSKKPKVDYYSKPYSVFCLPNISRPYSLKPTYMLKKIQYKRLCTDLIWENHKFRMTEGMIAPRILSLTDYQQQGHGSEPRYNKRAS